MPTKFTLINGSRLGAAEWYAEMLEFDDGGNRLAAHIGDGILVAEPVRAPDRIEHMPAPIILLDVSQRRADAALRCDCVAARREHLRHACGIETGGHHAQRRPQPGPAGAEHHDVEGMVDDLVTDCHANSP
jgi:hypothetical protein